MKAWVASKSLDHLAPGFKKLIEGAEVLGCLLVVQVEVEVVFDLRHCALFYLIMHMCMRPNELEELDHILSLLDSRPRAGRL